MPDAFDRKAPSASREFCWQFIFPASTICVDPRTRQQVRFHLHESAGARAYHDDPGEQQSMPTDDVLGQLHDKATRGMLLSRGHEPRLLGFKRGYLLNFYVPLLKQGIKRISI